MALPGDGDLGGTDGQIVYPVVIGLKHRWIRERFFDATAVCQLEAVCSDRAVTGVGQGISAGVRGAVHPVRRLVVTAAGGQNRGHKDRHPHAKSSHRPSRFVALLSVMPG